MTASGETIAVSCLNVDIGFLILRAVGDDARDDAFAGNVAVNAGKALHLLDLAADAQGDDFKFQRVSGHDRPSEFSRVDPAEEWDLGVAVFELTQSEDRPDLCKRFDLEDAGHNGSTGEMSLKEMLVNGDLFDADDANLWFEFYDLVDEEKRVAVRQYRLYCL